MNTDTAGRAVPAHRTDIFALRQHRHVLVIPVINEGERIRRQLRQIAELAPACDIVIADGGSTDGSLDPDFLRGVGVRALLTKTAPGKLSAQLRVAYAFALDEGYEGVVTVDGNGKDGMDAIPLFLEKLIEGYDYVQGSRYVAGGIAENTPRDRHLAGRLIHAPVLSLAAGHWYTDTTNGYRAYSARYLADPRVAPFRDVFMRYELLFYLTVRAARLGLRTTEVPVARRYPKDEATPTKISGMRGRVDMLGQLFAAASGKFNP